MITIVGKDNLEDFIWQSHKENKITVIYFGAIWCGPCQMLKDKINSKEAKSEMPNLSICYIDIDEEENEELSEQYKVKSLPLQIKAINTKGKFTYMTLVNEKKNTSFYLFNTLYIRNKTPINIIILRVESDDTSDTLSEEFALVLTVELLVTPFRLSISFIIKLIIRLTNVINES